MKAASVILTVLGACWLFLGFLYCFTNKAGRSGMFDPIVFSTPFVVLVVAGIAFAVRLKSPSALVRALVVTGIAGLAFGPFVEVMGIMTTHAAMAESGGRLRNPYAEILLIGFASVLGIAFALAVRGRPRSPGPNQSSQATGAPRRSGERSLTT